MSYEQSNYYQILGVSRDASTTEIEEAFGRLRAEFARDDGTSGDPNISYLLHAYEALSNPQRRRLYDSLLLQTAEPHLISSIQVSGQEIGVMETPQIVYLLAELRSQDMDDTELLPLNLCLVVDRSTSMYGERLERVKKALQTVVERLSLGDVLSVVSFSDRAEVVLPARHVGEHHESASKIQDIHASGGTEIYQGLLAGAQQLRQMPLGDYNNQLILLTDGYTYGDAGPCLRLATEIAAEGIVLNAFGIGTDWDDHFLDALVSPSNGQADYVDTPEKIVTGLETKLQGMGTTYARHVRLQEKWPRRVQLLDSFRLTPYAQPLRIEQGEIQLGDIEGRAPLTFLLEFSIAPHPVPTRIRIPLEFVAEVIGHGEQVLKEQVQLTIQVDAPTVEPPPKVMHAVRLLTLYRLNERAWQEAESGHLNEAATRMRYLSTRFLEAREPHLAKQADIEARRLTGSEVLSSEGRKRLKYGTRALMGKTIQLEWDDSL